MGLLFDAATSGFKPELEYNGFVAKQTVASWRVSIQRPGSETGLVLEFSGPQTENQLKDLIDHYDDIYAAVDRGRR